MVSHRRRRTVLTALGLYTFAALFIGYFAVNAFTGNHGLRAQADLDQQLATMQGELIAPESRARAMGAAGGAAAFRQDRSRHAGRARPRAFGPGRPARPGPAHPSALATRCVIHRRPGNFQPNSGCFRAIPPRGLALSPSGDLSYWGEREAEPKPYRLILPGRFRRECQWRSPRKTRAPMPRKRPPR